MNTESKQTFRSEVKSADLLLGTWVGSTDPMVTEAVAQSDFDFVILDAEHGSLDRMPLLINLIAARAGGARTIVRLGGDDPVHYMHALDNGADGVLVPRVKTAAEVARAVNLCRYPPEGVRGFGPHRAGGYYRHEDRYTATANDVIAVIVQIETREALDNLSEILEVEGLDGVLVGRNDLAGALGMNRDHNDPRMLSICADILRGARARGLARGIAASLDAEAIPALHELGANVIAAGGDLEFMVSAMDSYLSAIRREDMHALVTSQRQAASSHH